MADLGEIQVRIAVATKQLKADLAAAQAEFSKFGKKTEVEMSTMSAKVKSTFKRMGASMRAEAAAIGASISQSFRLAGMVLGAAFVYGSKKAIEFASDAQESMNLFRVVMGEGADDAMKWSRQFSEELSLNETQTRKYLSSLQLIIEAQGISAEESLKMSKALTKLTFDLASFRNLGFDEAFNKITSGIVGMPRPLRDVGINLQDAAIKEYAFANSIVNTDREMTIAEKTLARYGLLMEKTQLDRGDFLRTQNDYANSMRQLSDAFRTAGESYGKGLINAIKDGNSQLKTYLIDNQKEFEAWGEGVGVAITGVTVGFTEYTKGVSQFVETIGQKFEKLLNDARNARREVEVWKDTVDRLNAENPGAFYSAGATMDPGGLELPANLNYNPNIPTTNPLGMAPVDPNAARRKFTPRVSPAKQRQQEAQELKVAVKDSSETIKQELKSVDPQISKTGQLFQQWADSVGTKFQQMSNVIARSLDTVAETMTDFSLNGKADFSAMAESIARDIMLMIVKLRILNALMTAFPGLQPVISPVQNVRVVESHSGGTVGQGARQMNLPSMSMAPRFHNGLARDEQLTVLQDGEEVTPKGSSPKAVVNVNSPDVPINAEVTGLKQSMGNMIIDVLVSTKRRRDPRLAGF